MRRMVVASAVALMALLIGVGVASAHVTVWPKESGTGAYEKYTVRVPTEKEIPTVKVEVLFPEGLKVSSFQPKQGWTYETEKDAAGNITGVIWSGGSIGPGEFDEFSFIGANPRDPGQLAFKANQTYADGSVVNWDGPPESEHPASVTTISAQASAEGGSVEQANSTPAAGGATTGNTGNTAGTTNGTGSDTTSDSAPLSLSGTFWLGIIAVVLAVIGIALSGVTIWRRATS